MSLAFMTMLLFKRGAGGEGFFSLDLAEIRKPHKSDSWV